MATVRDLWTKKNPDPTSRIKRVHSARWGVGKRWQAVWTEDGKPVTEMFDSQEAAAAAVAKALTKQDEGTWITKDKKKITVGDVWGLFIATKTGTSKSSRDNYNSAWRTHIKGVWADRSCATIKRAEIVIWLDGLTTTKGVKIGEDPRPLGGSARRLVGLTLKGVLDTAVEEGIILTNPMRARDLPKQGTAERRYLTVPELDRLVDAAPTEQARRTVIVLSRTGVRPGEAWGFKVGDFSPVRGRIRVQRDVDELGHPDTTKTGRHRDVPAGGDLAMDLEDWTEGRGRDEWLLPATDDGHVWTAARWRRVWKKMRDAAGIEDSFDTYELRHTAASLAIHSGANVYTVARMLGHSDASTTMGIYGHLWDEELDMLPARVDAHMEAERKRFRDRRARAERRREERGEDETGSGLRVV